MLDKEHCYVIIHPGEKRPRGADWGKSGLTAAQVKQRLASKPDRNVGIILGPMTGIVDFDCDGPGADDYLRELFDGTMPTSPWWESRRGRHYLFQHHPRLASVAIVKNRGLEIRLGNGGQFQSVIPPSSTDGFTRTWGIDLAECEPASIPESVVSKILAIATTNTTAEIDHTPDPMLWEVEAVLQKAKIEKLAAYFDRNQIATRVHRDHHGRVFVHLSQCPFKPAGHTDGDPCVIVNPDGSHAWACRHAKCADMRWVDIEAIFGPLSPVIRVDADLERMVNESIHALATAPNVYQRGRVLVEVTREAPRPPQCLADNGAPQLRPIPPATLTVNLSSCARWEKMNERKKRHVRCLPPDAVVRAVDAASRLPGIPVVTGIVSCPVLRSDGSILVAPGYDRQTGLFLDTDGTYPPLMNPRDALDLLHDIVCDFPFATPANRSAWLAGLVTLLVRSAFAGPSPMNFVDANASRIGKGLATDIITMIFEGRAANRYSPPRDENEMRKLITAVGLSGASYLIFDNVKGKFGGESLENAMTTGRWSDRILGANKQVDLTLNLTWFATANNCTLTQDMIGRTCHIRLDTDLERPDLRTGFKHPDLLGYVKENRRKLAIAALSIPAAYIAAGRPDQHLPAWGGFDEWSDLVRGSLTWSGEPDPGETRAMLAESADDDSSLLGALMDGWAEIGSPATAATAIQFVENCPDKFAGLREVIAELPGHLDRRQALGTMLRQFRGRVLAGRRFVRTDHKIPKWSLENVTP